MREFFRGWKRKVGVVMLMMACAFAAAWVRSPTTVDYIYVDSALLGSHYICSQSREITWIRVNRRIVDWPVFKNSWPGIKFSSGSNNIPVSDQTEPKWFHQFQGDMAVAANSFAGMHGASVAHRAIIIPLTIISAWLLLSKPRARQQRPITSASEKA